MAEIVEVVRLIPQERVHQRTVEQIVHVPVPQIVEEIARKRSRLFPGAHLEAYVFKGRTKISCCLKENQSEFSETHRLKDLVKKTLRVRYQNGCGILRSVTLPTPAKTVIRRRTSRARSMSQSESSNRSSRCKCHCRLWKR